jgi:hypothetical protein
MNADFFHVIAASPDDRRDLFLTSAKRLGTPLQNIEKDFWVTWVLDLLFNGRQANEPRLLFKGGTSLSKAFGLISRFSEDIDITVFREDIGHEPDIDDFERLSGKQQRRQLEGIKQACQNYVQGALRDRLNRQISAVFGGLSLPVSETPVIVDPDDSDRQTLLMHYPSVSVGVNDYVKPTIKIEAGAKSALDPHCLASIRPYISGDIPATNLIVQEVVTIDAERTFWDKVVILHGLRRWHDKRGVLRQQGHRASRHYYDIFQLAHSPTGKKALADAALGKDCVRHARLFFNSADLDLLSAQMGRFAIAPTAQMTEVLRRDYQAMTTMIFGDVPTFTEVLESIRKIEIQLNKKSAIQ